MLLTILHQDNRLVTVNADCANVVFQRHMMSVLRGGGEAPHDGASRGPPRGRGGGGACAAGCSSSSILPRAPTPGAAGRRPVDGAQCSPLFPFLFAAVDLIAVPLPPAFYSTVANTQALSTFGSFAASSLPPEFLSLLGLPSKLADSSHNRQMPILASVEGWLPGSSDANDATGLGASTTDSISTTMGRRPKTHRGTIQPSAGISPSSTGGRGELRRGDAVGDLAVIGPKNPVTATSPAGFLFYILQQLTTSMATPGGPCAGDPADARAAKTAGANVHSEKASASGDLQEILSQSTMSHMPAAAGRASARGGDAGAKGRRLEAASSVAQLAGSVRDRGDMSLSHLPGERLRYTAEDILTAALGVAQWSNATLVGLASAPAEANVKELLARAQQPQQQVPLSRMLYVAVGVSLTPVGSPFGDELLGATADTATTVPAPQGAEKKGGDGSKKAAKANPTPAAAAAAPSSSAAQSTSSIAGCACAPPGSGTMTCSQFAALKTFPWLQNHLLGVQAGAKAAHYEHQTQQLLFSQSFVPPSAPASSVKEQAELLLKWPHPSQFSLASYVAASATSPFLPPPEAEKACLHSPATVVDTDAPIDDLSNRNAPAYGAGRQTPAIPDSGVLPDFHFSTCISAPSRQQLLLPGLHVPPDASDSRAAKSSLSVVQKKVLTARDRRSRSSSAAGPGRSSVPASTEKDRVESPNDAFTPFLFTTAADGGPSPKNSSFSPFAGSGSPRRKGDTAAAEMPHEVALERQEGATRFLQQALLHQQILESRAYVDFTAQEMDMLPTYFADGGGGDGGGQAKHCYVDLTHEASKVVASPTAARGKGGKGGSSKEHDGGGGSSGPSGKAQRSTMSDEVAPVPLHTTVLDMAQTAFANAVMAATIENLKQTQESSEDLGASCPPSCASSTTAARAVGPARTVGNSVKASTSRGASPYGGAAHSVPATAEGASSTDPSKSMGCASSAVPGRKTPLPTADNSRVPFSFLLEKSAEAYGSAADVVAAANAQDVFAGADGVGLGDLTVGEAHKLLLNKDCTLARGPLPADWGAGGRDPRGKGKVPGSQSDRPKSGRNGPGKSGASDPVPSQQHQQQQLQGLRRHAAARAALHLCDTMSPEGPRVLNPARGELAKMHLVSGRTVFMSGGSRRANGETRLLPSHVGERVAAEYPQSGTDEGPSRAAPMRHAEKALGRSAEEVASSGRPTDGLDGATPHPPRLPFSNISSVAFIAMAHNDGKAGKQRAREPSSIQARSSTSSIARPGTAAAPNDTGVSVITNAESGTFSRSRSERGQLILPPAGGGAAISAPVPAARGIHEGEWEGGRRCEVLPEHAHVLSAEELRATAPFRNWTEADGRAPRRGEANPAFDPAAVAAPEATVSEVAFAKETAAVLLSSLGSATAQQPSLVQIAGAVPVSTCAKSCRALLRRHESVGFGRLRAAGLGGADMSASALGTPRLTQRCANSSFKVEGEHGAVPGGESAAVDPSEWSEDKNAMALAVNALPFLLFGTPAVPPQPTLTKGRSAPPPAPPKLPSQAATCPSTGTALPRVRLKPEVPRVRDRAHGATSDALNDSSASQRATESDKHPLSRTPRGAPEKSAGSASEARHRAKEGASNAMGGDSPASKAARDYQVPQREKLLGFYAHLLQSSQFTLSQIDAEERRALAGSRRSTSRSSAGGSATTSQASTAAPRGAAAVAAGEGSSSKPPPWGVQKSGAGFFNGVALAVERDNSIRFVVAKPAGRLEGGVPSSRAAWPTSAAASVTLAAQADEARRSGSSLAADGSRVFWRGPPPLMNSSEPYPTLLTTAAVGPPAASHAAKGQVGAAPGLPAKLGDSATDAEDLPVIPRTEPHNFLDLTSLSAYPATPLFNPLHYMLPLSYGRELAASFGAMAANPPGAAGFGDTAPTLGPPSPPEVVKTFHVFWWGGQGGEVDLLQSMLQDVSMEEERKRGKSDARKKTLA